MRKLLLLLSLFIFAAGLPDKFDWRTYGMLPPVHNQGQMGSSYLYAAQEAIYTLGLLSVGRIVDPSLGELADCCGTGGGGQLSGSVFDCVAKLGGLCASSDYPISSKGSCRSKTCQVKVKVTGNVTISEGDEEALRAGVVKNPVLVLVDASHASFQMYRSGVYHEPNCSQKRVDHGMLLVGYGTTAGGEDYWILMNSWGTAWGQSGYMLMARNANNMCGVASYASYPVYR